MKFGTALFVVMRPQKMRYNYSRSLAKTRTLKAGLTAVFSVLLAGSLFVSLQFVAFTMSRRNVMFSAAHDSLAGITQVQPIQQTVLDQKLNLKATFDTVQLQSVLDTWRAKSRGTGSVVVLDADSNELLAQTNQSQQYFTASLYKLYIAYLAIQDIDTGVHTLNETFISGQTRAQCLNNMIRNSDSTCAEVMMSEQPRAVWQKRLENLGLKGTNMVRLTTTAQDAAFVTQKIATGEGLSQASTNLLHTAMHLQIYRDGLQKGFKGLEVYDKVGFYEVGWYDSAFIRLPSGKLVVVAVLTQDMGTRQVQDLAKKLQPLLAGI